MIERFLRDLSEMLPGVFGVSPETQRRLLISLAVVLLVWGLRMIVLRFALRHAHSPEQTYRWSRGTRYAAVTLLLLLLGRVWIHGFEAFLTYLGILSAGIAIALSDVLKNFAGWLFLIWRRPFSIGDRIQIGEIMGDVIDMRIFQFTILEVGNWVKADQSTGRIIHVPNGKVFTEPTANFYSGFEYIWSELPVLVTFESDWRRAKQILAEIADRHGAHLSDAAEKRIHEAATRYMTTFRRKAGSVPWVAERTCRQVQACERR